MSRIVSLTPVALEGDLRTRKEASSFARMGHESLVVEGRTSRSPVPGLRVVTLGGVGEAIDASGGPSGSSGPAERIAAFLGRVAGPVYFAASHVAANLMTAVRLPPADLYWLHGYEQFLAVRLRRRPFVYDAHDLYAALPGSGGPLPWRDRAVHALRERIERACVRTAAACVTTSDAMARACEARFGVAFAVVRNAQDTRLARPAEGDVRSAAGVSDGAFLIVMVGHAKPGLVAPGELPEGVELVLVGAGHAPPATPGVHVLPPVPGDEVASFLRTADAAALLYEPVDENSPTQLFNGLFHAVSAGLPLLWPAGMPAVAELCERHGLGVPVDPADAASLARGIEELRARREELRATVRSAQAELSWEREEGALEAVLRRALA